MPKSLYLLCPRSDIPSSVKLFAENLESETVVVEDAQVLFRRWRRLMEAVVQTEGTCEFGELINTHHLAECSSCHIVYHRKSRPWDAYKVPD
ncbi:hypothetical protein VTO42DRAFT_6566 [Malbranchea cinnamomea]